MAKEHKPNTKVSIIGLGFVGQTLSVALAEAGITVYGAEVDENIVSLIRKAQSHVREKQLNELIAQHLDKKLFVGTACETLTNEVDAFIICVNSPVNNSLVPRGDMQPLALAVQSIKPFLRPGHLVIVRTTVPVGTTRNLVKPLLEEGELRAGKDFGLAFAPERTVEGNAINELRTLPQIVGGIDKDSSRRTGAIFDRLTPTIVYVSSLEHAELTKLLDNTYRDVTFAYANEIARYCEKMGLDAFEVIKSANLNYPRNHIPFPSPGVGGPCLKKDPYILLESARSVGEKLELVARAREINKSIPLGIVKRLTEQYILANKAVFVAGFAFKGRPETNDIRNSPTVDLVEGLIEQKAFVIGYDPVVERCKIESLGAQYAATLEEGLEKADIAIFMTNHESFSRKRVSNALSRMKRGGLLFDGWGLLSKEMVERHGLKYMGVGIG